MEARMMLTSAPIVENFNSTNTMGINYQKKKTTNKRIVMVTNKISAELVIRAYRETGLFPICNIYLDGNYACSMGALGTYLGFNKERNTLISIQDFIAQKLGLDYKYVLGFEGGFCDWEDEYYNKEGYNDGQLVANEVAKVFGEFRQATLDIAG